MDIGLPNQLSIIGFHSLHPAANRYPTLMTIGRTSELITRRYIDLFWKPAKGRLNRTAPCCLHGSWNEKTACPPLTETMCSDLILKPDSSRRFTPT